MVFVEARRYPYESLRLCTNNFSEENLIGQFQFGRVYRGRILDDSTDEVKEVTVKVWEDPKIYLVIHPQDNEPRMLEEITLLQNQFMVSHPRLMRLLGYCEEGEQLGVVYDFKALDTVDNLILEESFTWAKRIKVAIQFASILEFLHTPMKMKLPYLVRNLDAAHLLLDQDYNVKLYDFGMISGGIFLDRREQIFHVYGCYGYIDLHTSIQGFWSEETDIFAFGIVLLLMITKRVVDVEDMRSLRVPLLHVWARGECEDFEDNNSSVLRVSLVHRSLKVDPDFSSSDGDKITKLAIRCVAGDPKKRPRMKQVLKCLKNLQVARNQAEIRGVHDKPQKAKHGGMLRCVPF